MCIRDRVLTDLDNGTTFTSERSIDEVNEQLIVEYGISVEINQVSPAGSNESSTNGAIGVFEEFGVENTEPWFRGVTDGISDIPADQTGFARNFFDFIKNENEDVDPDVFRSDPNRNFNNLGNGYWYPFMQTSSVPVDGIGTIVPFLTPAWNEETTGMDQVRPSNLSLIHI